jgi:hypothetical protein
MTKLTEEQFDWQAERIPDHELSSKGGRPPADELKVMQGIFWILDNDAGGKTCRTSSAPRVACIVGSRSGQTRGARRPSRAGSHERTLSPRGHAC